MHPLGYARRMEPSPVDDSVAGVPAQRTEGVTSEVVPGAGVPVVPPGSSMAVRATRVSPWPMRLAIFVGVVSLLCVGGLGIAYHLYDVATKPDRSSPDITVHSYLQAMLIDRSNSEATQFTCVDSSQLLSFRQYVEQIESREVQFHATTSFSWGPLTVSRHGNSAAVTVEITQRTFVANSVEAAESQHAWTFDVTGSADWRVCGAARLS